MNDPQHAEGTNRPRGPEGPGVVIGNHHEGNEEIYRSPVVTPKAWATESPLETNVIDLSPSPASDLDCGIASDATLDINCGRMNLDDSSCCIEIPLEEVSAK